MSNILKIFTGDIKRLLRNPVATIIVIGVLFIPSLYAWFNIAANMDPYANTGSIKIAVSSDDLGTESDLTGDLNAGDQIIEKLKENDEIGWTFVSSAEAVEGVESGEYYAAIIIPSTFSEDIISFLSGDIKKPEIDYYLNEKLNAIAPKVTDTGASTIQTQINQTFISVASETLANILNSSTDTVTADVTDAETSLLDDLDQVDGLLAEYNTQWEAFQTAYNSLPDLTEKTSDLLDTVRTAADNGQDTVNRSNSLLSSTRQDVTGFTSKMSAGVISAESALNELSAQVNTKIADINVPVQQTTGKIADVITSLESIIDLNAELISGLQEFDSSFPDSPAADVIAELQSDNARHSAVLESLKAASESIGSAADTLASFSSSLMDTTSGAEGILAQAGSSVIGSSLPALNSSLDAFSGAAGTLSGVLANVDPTADQIEQLLSGLNDTLDSVFDALSGTSDALDGVTATIDDVKEKLNSLASSLSYQQLLSTTGLDADSISDFMSSPIEVRDEVLYPVENYGSGVTPFYTNLALWVSGIVLIAIFKLEVVDEDGELEDLTTTETFFGRGLLFLITGLIQALLIALGDIYLLKVQCVKPGLFILACLFISVIYVSFIYAMSLTFKHIGKALCVILVILQIPGSAGTYPIEMTPAFFRALHPLLPFTYGVTALRECVAGLYKNTYGKSLAVMLIYPALALFIGLVVRRFLIGLNRLFDRRLQETTFMICDEVEEDGEEGALSDRLARRSDRFYRLQIRVGFLTIIFLPILFLILLFVFDCKMVFLILWIASIVVIACYLVVVEYVHDRSSRRADASEYDDDYYDWEEDDE